MIPTTTKGLASLSVDNRIDPSRLATSLDGNTMGLSQPGIDPITDFQKPQGINLSDPVGIGKINAPSATGVIDSAAGIISTVSQDTIQGAQNIDQVKRAGKGKTMNLAMQGAKAGLMTGNPLIAAGGFALGGIAGKFMEGAAEKEALKKFNDEEVKRQQEEADRTQLEYFKSLDKDRIGSMLELKKEQLGYL